MNHLHTVIVPGVGGSDQDHWQSWLQRHLSDSSRVEQQDWNLPILNQWVDQFYQHVRQLNRPVRIVAHSFGCLTTIAALNQYPNLSRWVHSILLVAPANPARFSQHGFANSDEQLGPLFQNFSINVPSLMIISENDPWLSYSEATEYSKLWNIPYINQGLAGHINVASGYGKWPELLHYIDNISMCSHKVNTDYFATHQHFHFAV
ncbi:RBBP9/YdeN family alpha/beta hydrolase [Acinetobacter populi]|uniref:Esterase n=1 Tax=Acinetobacter populi TaxID=1582270 RepID=A0A1Z9YZR3_9GAMM|nr:alpha/beta hydrolase [Acinetobacter populi]OUY07700.1 esterase [Acinetobacter populi]